MLPSGHSTAARPSNAVRTVSPCWRDWPSVAGSPPTSTLPARIRRVAPPPPESSPQAATTNASTVATAKSRRVVIGVILTRLLPPRQSHPPLVHPGVVVAAEQHQVVERGRAAIRPVDQMVG